MTGSIDTDTVTRQIGRPPRGSWRTVVRCRFSRPQVIAVAPLLEDGTPFPTALWLTCPALVESVGRAESAGWGADLRAWSDSDPRFADRAVRADEAYRWFRTFEGGGTDPCAGVGVAGQSDPLAVKCLHARVASRLAGIDDPFGDVLLGEFARECACDRCAPVPCGSEAPELAGASA